MMFQKTSKHKVVRSAEGRVAEPTRWQVGWSARLQGQERWQSAREGQKHQDGVGGTEEEEVLKRA